MDEKKYAQQSLIWRIFSGRRKNCMQLHCYYDSFVESEAFANTSEFYKTAVSIIESNVEEVQQALGEAFKELLTLVREEKSKTKEE